jgi:hypothetical protein
VFIIERKNGSHFDGGRPGNKKKKNFFWVKILEGIQR